MQRGNPVVNHYSASLPLPSNATIYELADGSIQITVPAPTDSVIAELQSAVLLSETDPRLRVFLAMSLIQAGRWKDAEAHVRDGLHYNPEDADLHMLLAEISEHNGILQTAVHEGRLAISYMKQNKIIAGTTSEAIALNFVAGLLASAGHRSEAAQSLQRAIDIMNEPRNKAIMSLTLLDELHSTLKALSGEDA